MCDLLSLTRFKPVFSQQTHVEMSEQFCCSCISSLQRWGKIINMFVSLCQTAPEKLISWFHLPSTCLAGQQVTLSFSYLARYLNIHCFRWIRCYSAGISVGMRRMKLIHYLIRSCKVYRPSVASCSGSHDKPAQIIFNVGTDERLKTFIAPSGGKQCCSKSKWSSFPLTRPLSSPICLGSILPHLSTNRPPKPTLLTASLRDSSALSL